MAFVMTHSNKYILKKSLRFREGTGHRQPRRSFPHPRPSSRAPRPAQLRAGCPVPKHSPAL